jgi:hypothetical protein
VKIFEAGGSSALKNRNRVSERVVYYARSLVMSKETVAVMEFPF